MVAAAGNYGVTKDGAPIEEVFAPEGVPIVPYADGIPKTAKNPNAAKLFMNWRLSVEGQTFMIKELGNLTSLKVPPAYPEGFDPKVRFGSARPLLLHHPKTI